MVLYNFFQEIALLILQQATPLIVFFDEWYQKYYKEHEEEVINLETSDHYHYDYENDIIKINYIASDKHYVFCFDRRANFNVKDIVENKLEKINSTEDLLMMAELNGNDITSRVNMYVGSEGCHLQYSDIKVKYFLTEEEINTFEKLIIMDNMCNEKIYTSIEDFLEWELM
jgi:hypothetical protein